MLLHIWMAAIRFLVASSFSSLLSPSINQEKLHHQWDGWISQAENSFTSKHVMKKLLLINLADSRHDVKSLTNLSK